LPSTETDSTSLLYARATTASSPLTPLRVPYSCTQIKLGSPVSSKFTGFLDHVTGLFNTGNSPLHFPASKICWNYSSVGFIRLTRLIVRLLGLHKALQGSIRQVLKAFIKAYKKDIRL
jgi:hypothetical protein